MFRLVLSLLLVAGLAAPAWAQAKKPKRCLTVAEMTTEQIVRHGVFLRELGTRCEEFTPGTKKLWTDFDTNFAARLKALTDKRKLVYQREFKDDWVKVMTYFDGRLVTHHRHVPLTRGTCDNVQERLQEVTKKGWKGFTEQAKILQNEVHQDYKICK